MSCVMLSFADDGDNCYDDPLLHFPFAFDFDDIQCPKAVGLAFGDAVIDEDGGYMSLDGDGDYMTVLKQYIYPHYVG